MGRKIKGKNHRGIKDPREQALRRFESIYNKIDNPPSYIDEQKIPEKVLKIMEFQNRPIQIRKKKKKSKRKLLSTSDLIPKEVELPGMTRPVKTPENVTQRRDESDFQFYLRASASCMQSFREAYFENKFNVQVQRDPETGVVTGVQHSKKTEADAIIEEMKASKKKKKKLLTKNEKRKLKLIAKVEMKNEHETVRDFSDFKDEVKFGEVVHCPPELTVLPKRKNVTGSLVQKPGQRDLLLKNMLKEGEVRKKAIAAKNKTQHTEARKKMLEEERIRVVELYRSMKNKKN